MPDYSALFVVAIFKLPFISFPFLKALTPGSLSVFPTTTLNTLNDFNIHVDNLFKTLVSQFLSFSSNELVCILTAGTYAHNSNFDITKMYTLPWQKFQVFQLLTILVHWVNCVNVNFLPHLSFQYFDTIIL